MTTWIVFALACIHFLLFRVVPFSDPNLEEAVQRHNLLIPPMPPKSKKQKKEEEETKDAEIDVIHLDISPHKSNLYRTEFGWSIENFASLFQSDQLPKADFHDRFKVQWSVSMERNYNTEDKEMLFIRIQHKHNPDTNGSCLDFTCQYHLYNWTCELDFIRADKKEIRFDRVVHDEEESDSDEYDNNADQLRLMNFESNTKLTIPFDQKEKQAKLRFFCDAIDDHTDDDNNDDDTKES